MAWAEVPSGIPEFTFEGDAIVERMREFETVAGTEDIGVDRHSGLDGNRRPSEVIGSMFTDAAVALDEPLGVLSNSNSREVDPPVEYGPRVAGSSDAGRELLGVPVLLISTVISLLISDELE